MAKASSVSSDVPMRKVRTEYMAVFTTTKSVFFYFIRRKKLFLPSRLLLFDSERSLTLMAMIRPKQMSVLRKPIWRMPGRRLVNASQAPDAARMAPSVSVA